MGRIKLKPAKPLPRPRAEVDRSPPAPAGSSPTRWWPRIAVGAVVMLVLGAAAWLFVLERHQEARAEHGASLTSSPSKPPLTLAEILALPLPEIERIDVARANLLCAVGLPGSSALDVDRAVATIDVWASRVAAETERNHWQFQRSPSDFKGSDAYFRMLMLITVLQQDFGVRYNPQLIGWEWPFHDSRYCFLHGMLPGESGGSCSSMPVLYAVVGQRLGYPLHLVSAKGHFFCRWDGTFRGQPAERLNVEGTNQGMSEFPDDHYRTWPFPISDAEVASGRYLRNLTRAETLAAFLGLRAACWEDTGNEREAAEAYAQAARLDPSNIEFRQLAGRAQSHAEKRLRAERDQRRLKLDSVEDIHRFNEANRRRAGHPGGVPELPRPPDPLSALQRPQSVYTPPGAGSPDTGASPAQAPWAGNEAPAHPSPAPYASGTSPR